MPDDRNEAENLRTAKIAYLVEVSTAVPDERNNPWERACFQG